jgi:hypothetical protein
MRTAPFFFATLATLVTACGPSVSGGGDDEPGGPIDARIDAPVGGDVDAQDSCPPPPTMPGPEVQLAAQYAPHYTVYDLGPVPGVPNPLGGATVHITDDDTLLIGGNSENGSGAIYEIGVTRNGCGHITGWNGTATQHAATPYVDANLVYVNSQLMLYTQWPMATLSQLPVGASASARDTDLRTVGLPSGDSGPGGLGIVPPGLAGAGGLRMVTWPGGYWLHVDTTPDNGLLGITGVTQTATIANNPGGFAYVPAGSPGFTQQAIIVAEWVATDPSQDRVAVYDADAQGDPIVATRREFMTRFPRPWGAYFEPLTGDYLFLSWGAAGTDRVYVVQGFAPPPPID